MAKEGLFIPIGWDSTEKINVDFQNQQLTTDPNQPYSEIIQKPSSVLQQVCDNYNCKIFDFY